MLANILVKLDNKQTKKDLEKSLPCFSMDYEVKETQTENVIEVSFDNSQKINKNFQNETPVELIRRYTLDNGFKIIEQ